MPLTKCSIENFIILIIESNVTVLFKFLNLLIVNMTEIITFHGIGEHLDLSKGVCKRGIYLKLENSTLYILYCVCVVCVTLNVGLTCYHLTFLSLMFAY